MLHSPLAWGDLQHVSNHLGIPPAFSLAIVSLYTLELTHRRRFRS